MSEKEQQIPELDEPIQQYPTIYGELKISRDYGDLRKFTLQQLEERCRYYILLEMDPETNSRQMRELNLILNRLATEITLRRQEQGE